MSINLSVYHQKARDLENPCPKCGRPGGHGCVTTQGHRYRDVCDGRLVHEERRVLSDAARQRRLDTQNGDRLMPAYKPTPKRYAEVVKDMGSADRRKWLGAKTRKRRDKAKAARKSRKKAN